jgi:hypothetical protein
MRWTRNARNRATERKITLAEATQVVEDPDVTFTDRKGNPCSIAEVAGRRIKVVVAADDPELIVTVIDLDK